MSKKLDPAKRLIAMKPAHRVLVDADGAYYVPISHQELDNLVGRLMQMCDLTGDQEQRVALKSTIKQITRDWLDDEYKMNGYDKWDGAREDAIIIKA